ncbi:MAG: tyrosine-type recombinase/integrase [Bacilli bacterium]
MIKNDFSKILESYFLKHLKLERKYSENTYTTYLSVISQFINYLKADKGIKAGKISIENFSKDNILDFLNYVESDLGCSSKTRNHKLTVINSFLEYAQSINPIYIKVFLDSKSIKLKRVTKVKQDFMTIEELEAFFKSINIKTKDGYKHYVLFTVLYETGTRVSELINIKTSNLFFNNQNPYIRILGKGNKERIIYVNDNVVKIVNEYMSKLKINDGYLFTNHCGEPYTRFGINKLVDKYYEISKKECPTLSNKTVTPHTFRHSKAVHFLQNGTALPIIQRFLGHASIQTTEIYLDITNDVVIEAVNLAANLINVESKKALWSGDDKLIEMLEGLK